MTRPPGQGLPHGAFFFNPGAVPDVYRPVLDVPHLQIFDPPQPHAGHGGQQAQQGHPATTGGGALHDPAQQQHPLSHSQPQQPLQPQQQLQTHLHQQQAHASTSTLVSLSGSGSGGSTPARRRTPPFATKPYHNNNHSHSHSLSHPQQSSHSSMHTNAPRSVRSRNGCYTCRKRKVKCDERTPVCIKCEYSGRQCHWPPDDPLIRRKNRPRKMRLGLDGLEEGHTRPQVDEATRCTLRVPISTLQAFGATLPHKAIRGYDRSFAESLMPGKLRANMMMDSAFLEPYFPAVDERLIFRHYISHTVHLNVAFDDPSRSWNPWLSLIAPLAFKHLPGTFPAADALRASLLSIGSVHLHYIADPNDQAGAKRLMSLSRATVLGLVRKALEGPDGTTKEVDKAEVELILAALLGCIVASSLAADGESQPLLATVVSLVRQMGGAELLLKDAPRDHLSICRFVLEQIVIRDVFGCIDTEQPPMILCDRFMPWFFKGEQWSRTNEEWESVERLFGVSRGMVILMAKTCALVSHIRQAGHGATPLTNTSPAVSAPSVGAMSTVSVVSTLSALSTSAPSTASAGPLTGIKEEASTAPPSPVSARNLDEEADALMAELKAWDAACHFIPHHPRTQYGNIAHRHAMTIRLLREVFGVSKDDARVYRAATAIVEIAVEMVSRFGHMAWLTWPVTLAAFQLPKGDDLRDVVLSLLSMTGRYACYDVAAARRTVTAYWEADDEGSSEMTPWDVVNQMGETPIID